MSLVPDAQLARLALAEAMELLDRAVADATRRLDKAHEEATAASAEYIHWRARRDQFKQAVRGESATGGME